MPLSKARNRERMRALRATCVQPTISGLEIKGNRILGCTKMAVQPVEIIPELDADGHLLPDYE